MEFKKRILASVGHPNRLTMFRIASVPLLILLMVSPSRWSGFFAALVFCAAIIPLLIHYEYLGINFHAIGYTLLWVALIITIWSGIDYFVRFRKLLKY